MQLSQRFYHLKHTLASRSASVAFASSLFLISGATFADPADPVGPYLKGQAGLFKSRGGDFDDQNALFEAGLGYRFLPFVAAELNYINFGEYGNDLASAKVDGFKISALGILPLSSSFELTGEIGQFYSSTDYEVLEFDGNSSDETLFLGVGVNFLISGPLWLNIEYQRYSTEINADDLPGVEDSDTDIDTLSAGITFNF